MKFISAILFLLLLVTSTALGQWRKGEERVADAADRKSVSGFGVYLVLVENPKAFVEEWAKPETPNIDPATEVKRGTVFGAVVLFTGCKPDAQGVCNAEVDYMLYKPDGSLYAERKAQPIWKEKAPPVPNIQLSNAILGFRMEPNDPPGQYKVKAKVSDLNAGVSFEVETTFRLN